MTLDEAIATLESKRGHNNVYGHHEIDYDDLVEWGVIDPWPPDMEDGELSDSEEAGE